MAARINEKIAGSGVSANTRTCIGRQTISVTTGAVSTLTVPAGANAALIQADGYAVSMTLDGTTPTLADVEAFCAALEIVDHAHEVAPV